MPNGLRNLRDRKGLTQQAAADKMGMSKSGYVKIERSERKLSDDRLRAAMKAFNATEREVLGSATEQSPAQQSAAAEAPDQAELTGAEAEALGRACVMLMAERSGATGAEMIIEALLEVVRRRGGDASLLDLDSLRQAVRTVSDLSRSGMLGRNRRNT